MSVHRRVRGFRPEERGSVTVVMASVLVVALAACLGAARLGAGAVASARADAAADAAALAAADSLALGDGADAAAVAARTTASANGARLTRCRCDGSEATVAVVVDSEVLGASATSTARAEVRRLLGSTPQAASPES